MGLREATKRGRSTPGAGAGSWVNLKYLSDAPVLLGLGFSLCATSRPTMQTRRHAPTSCSAKERRAVGKGGPASQQARSIAQGNRGFYGRLFTALLCARATTRQSRDSTHKTALPRRTGGVGDRGGNEPRGGPRLAGVRCKPTEEDHQDHIGMVQATRGHFFAVVRNKCW